MISLIGGGNFEGYDIALMKVFTGRNSKRRPNRSAFSRMRSRISYRFFADQLTKLLSKFESIRHEYLGLRIYAIDGQMLTLPKTKDLVKEGYSGRAVSHYRESYYPKGFLTHAYDVLSGVTKAFVFGPRLNEQDDAKSMIKAFEENSLTLYDRLYFCFDLVEAHYEIGNYFIFRCRENACAPIAEFFRSKDRVRINVVYRGLKLHLIKTRNPETKEESVFATNLDPAFLREKLIWKLYRLRWEVETGFREITAITKAEQWHSKSSNGILQELYCRLWLINYTKIQKGLRSQKPKNPLRDVYEKPSFKLLYQWIIFHFPKILRRTSGVWKDFEGLTKRSLERRRHQSRRYKRELKRPASPYKYNNTIWYWDR
jgi:hypothetical protein